MMDLGLRQLPQPMSTEMVLMRSFFLTAAIVGEGENVVVLGVVGRREKWEAVGLRALI